MWNNIFYHLFKSYKDLNILVAYGDTPAVTGETFKNFISFHKKNNNIFQFWHLSQKKNPLAMVEFLQILMIILKVLEKKRL